MLDIRPVLGFVGLGASALEWPRPGSGQGLNMSNPETLHETISHVLLTPAGLGSGEGNFGSWFPPKRFHDLSQLASFIPETHEIKILNRPRCESGLWCG